jgi:hypothetical protein
MTNENPARSGMSFSDNRLNVPAKKTHQFIRMPLYRCAATNTVETILSLRSRRLAPRRFSDQEPGERLQKRLAQRSAGDLHLRSIAVASREG